jgi:hypothetical protein
MADFERFDDRVGALIDGYQVVVVDSEWPPS